jgi:pimeloyl-ACP methyl ester carboxylesterase
MDSDLAARAYRTRPDAYASTEGTLDETPSLLLAHGTLMDHGMFDPQLADLRDDHHVAAYDLRARTEFWAGPYDLDDLVADCDAVMDGLGLDQPVLGGMSMGGFMAIRYALDHPDRLSGLVLMDTIAASHEPAEREQYAGMVEDLPEADAVPRELAEAAAHFLFGETTMVEDERLVDAWIDRWTTYPPGAVYHEVHSWLDRPDVHDRLDEIDVPVLVVHGEEDESFAPERAEAMVEALPDARMVTVPNAGHSANLERPAVVNDAIREFMDDL